MSSLRIEPSPKVLPTPENRPAPMPIFVSDPARASAKIHPRRQRGTPRDFCLSRAVARARGPSQPRCLLVRETPRAETPGQTAVARVLGCRRGDLNPHALAGTSPSSWRVCLFRHSDGRTG
jgi:hypothetical protein